eukprot:Sspe_Gene.54554::Locus_30105_Transcript_1_1_Confidence_1.000_Length_511::g.54554::m.54554
MPPFHAAGAPSPPHPPIHTLPLPPNGLRFANWSLLFIPHFFCFSPLPPPPSPSLTFFLPTPLQAQSMRHCRGGCPPWAIPQCPPPASKAPPRALVHYGIPIWICNAQRLAQALSFTPCPPPPPSLPP